jgi:hypothetical protein
MAYPAKSLTKTMIVPEWDSGKIFLYTPDVRAATLGQAVVNPNFTVDVQTILNNVIGTATDPMTGKPVNYIPNINACALYSADLYFTNDSQSTFNAQGALTGAGSQAIFKLPGYLANPATAVAEAFVVDLQGSDYIGLTFSTDGTLFASVDFGGGHQITRYPGAGAVGQPTGQVTPQPFTLTGDNPAAQPAFGDLAFDSKGNLWAADYANNRLVVIAATALQDPGATSAWVALGNGTGGSFSVANPFGASKTLGALLVGPEGLDFDGFGGNGSLWVGNNNDGNTGIGQTAFTSLVQITPTLLQKVWSQLAANPGTTLAANTLTAGTDYNIFQVPNYTGALPQFGGLQVDKAAGRLYVNDEIGGWVRGYDIGTLGSIANTPGDTDSQVAPNHITDARGNGGIALVPLGVFIQDDTADAGAEPDTGTETAPNVPWESLSIVATSVGGAQTTLPAPYADPDPSLGFDGSDTVLGNTSRNVYVQGNFASAMPITGQDVLELYWGKASANLQWPAPWDGSETDAGTGAKLGGPIGNKPIAILTGGSGWSATPFPPFVYGPFAWQTPDPTKYTVQDGHFCLLARIVTTNASYAQSTASDSSDSGDASIGNAAGMTVPETPDLIANVVNNARIAWRNIHIVATEPPGGTAIRRLPPGVLLNNFGRAPLHVRVGFTLLDEQRRLIREPGGALLVSAKGSSLAVLEGSSLGKLPHADPHRPEHRCAPVPHLATGIDRLHLEPREQFVFHVDYQPPEGLRHYAVRASAFALQPDGSERLIGGQTFVYGKVAGFSAPLHRPPLR